MSFIILPKNTAKDAILVEQKLPILIDSTTPIEVDVQQPVSIDDNGSSITVDGVVDVNLRDDSGLAYSDSNPLPTASSDLIATQLETDNDTLNLLNDVLSELRIMNVYNAMAHNQELTKEDLE